MGNKSNRHPQRIRKLANSASLAELIAKAARKQKVLAKADLRAARKSLKFAKEVAKRARRAAREAARRA
jgi:uncharacterized protein HemY